MYLSQSGVRSLRARNSSLAAAVSDIGSPLDPLIQDLFRAMGPDWMSGTIALLQPVTGRFWIIMAGSKADADVADDIEDLRAVGVSGSEDHGLVGVRRRLRHHRRVHAPEPRGGARRQQHVYAYGGISDVGPVYDDCPVELVFPFHAGEGVATSKTFTALDATCSGVPWQVSVAFNVAGSHDRGRHRRVQRPSFPQGKIADPRPLHAHVAAAAVAGAGTADPVEHGGALPGTGKRMIEIAHADAA